MRTFVLAAALCAACAAPRDTVPAAPAPIAESGPAESIGGDRFDPELNLAPARFEDLPGWAETDHAAALEAFRATCPRFTPRDPAAPAGPPYAATNGAWRAACAAAAETSLDPAAARRFFERAFVPLALTRTDGAMGKTTAYYEPEIPARRTRSGRFAEPLLARPADLVALEVPADRYNQTTRLEITKRTGEGDYALYDDRGAIRARPDIPVLAWGRLEDVVFLQIQGSGRLVFEDGAIERAAYAAHNGARYSSIPRELIARGHLPRGGASNDAVKQWLASAELSLADDVVNANPRYVFFDLKPLGDPNEGPPGAAGVPLIPQASMAIDPDHHLIGGLYVVAPEGEEAPVPRLAVAQDTGGAIKGPLRSDFYFGTGAAAGAAAARVNHPTRWWALTPRAAP